VPVRTALVLLRPEVDGPELTGRPELRLPEGDIYDWFRFDMVRMMIEGGSAMILGIRGIEESSVYQSIFAKGRVEGEAKGRVEEEAKGRVKGEAKGRVEEARQALLHVGSKRLDQPDEHLQKRLEVIDDVDRLNALLEGILGVSTWDKLLAAADRDQPA